MKVILNGKSMKTKDTTHKYIKEKLKLPEYNGENLDALWDILSSSSDEIIIYLVNRNRLIENLGEYGKDLVKVFKDLVEENKNIKLKIIS